MHFLRVRKIKMYIQSPSSPPPKPSKFDPKVNFANFGMKTLDDCDGRRIIV